MVDRDGRALGRAVDGDLADERAHDLHPAAAMRGRRGIIPSPVVADLDRASVAAGVPEADDDRGRVGLERVLDGVRRRLAHGQQQVGDLVAVQARGVEPAAQPLAAAGRATRPRPGAAPRAAARRPRGGRARARRRRRAGPCPASPGRACRRACPRGRALSAAAAARRVRARRRSARRGARRARRCRARARCRAAGGPPPRGRRCSRAAPIGGASAPSSQRVVPSGSAISGGGCPALA